MSNDCEGVTPSGEETHKGHPIVQGFRCQAGNRELPGLGEVSGWEKSARPGRPWQSPPLRQGKARGLTPRMLARPPSRSAPSLPGATPSGHQGALTLLPHEALLDVADISEEVAHRGDLWT